MTVYVCDGCGGEAVFHDAFVNVNDHSDFHLFDAIYCTDCEKFTTISKKVNGYLKAILDRD